MNWKHLTSLEQLKEIDHISTKKPVLIFKHSTRCSISSTALNRLERNWNDKFEELLEVYYLDLLNYRIISDTIAEKYQVTHQSPQALIIRNNNCSFSQTHSEIRLEDLLNH